MNSRRLIVLPSGPGLTAYHIVAENAALCITANLAADVADGSNSAVAACPRQVRFTPQ